MEYSDENLDENMMDLTLVLIYFHSYYNNYFHFYYYCYYKKVYLILFFYYQIRENQDNLFLKNEEGNDLYNLVHNYFHQDLNYFVLFH